MGAKIIIAIIFAGLAVYVYRETMKIFEVPPLPDFGEIWWGPGDPSKVDTTIKPFTINISNKVIDDLNNRLVNALPFQAPLEGVKHHYGINSNLLKKIIDFWKKDYNWREREKFLNQYPQFKTNIQGLNIHYIHVKPKQTAGVKVLPMLLLHGWPGSVREFYEMIPLLTTPQKGRDFVFEVIVPSLPGYGFSDGAIKPGLNPIHMAIIFKNLMKRIGFEKYYVQGGDAGAVIVQHMSVLYPEQVIGVHSNTCLINTPLASLKLLIGNYFPYLISLNNEDIERMYPLSKMAEHILLEFGYFHLHATKPDTLGVSLRESPVGLAAYILEKFITWTNPAWKDLDDGGLTKKYTYTNLLDNLMIYWVTGSITTSVRLYAETANKAALTTGIDQIPVQVPSACARFKYELFYQPDSILKEKYPNLVQSVNYQYGGHFAAFEVPDILAKDIFDFVEQVETPKKKQS